jgi:hypothetical protein
MHQLSQPLPASTLPVFDALTWRPFVLDPLRAPHAAPLNQQSFQSAAVCDASPWPHHRCLFLTSAILDASISPKDHNRGADSAADLRHRKH